MVELVNHLQYLRYLNNMDDKKKKPTLADIQRDLEKGREIAEIGRVVPGGPIIVNQVDTGIEVAEQGISIFKKVKNLFGKKKK